MLEVCVTGLAAARVAAAAGADRIELCRDLRCGGLTPEPEVLREVRAHVALPIVVLIRCRSGDFVYSQTEQAIMLDEARRALDLGADGVAVGACHADHSLDWAFFDGMATAVRAAHGKADLVVHRVFDTGPDKHAAALRLADMGYDRLLTSGGTERAIDSLAELKALQAAHSHRITVLPAGGVTSDNARHILTSTGCRHLHGSFRSRSAVSAPEEPCPHEIAAVKKILAESTTT